MNLTPTQKAQTIDAFTAASLKALVRVIQAKRALAVAEDEALILVTALDVAKAL